ncbi:MAG: sn-glycerol-3-phosphate ABC transporter ATP-binding protein UgpC [Desulfobulbaceae bacterium]|nr:sn-glycerol-3-phosphate ABC transporter ATP-binding protein UgpC [Desulfobulbaceae bacterium]
MAGIVLDHISKTFADGTVAVSDVSLAIADGEFFILLGPSGCGKSTLLNMIVGLETVSLGSIKVDGQIVNNVDPKDRNMAMVFQSYALYPHMNVRQNMEFPLKLAGMEKREIARKVHRAASILELEDLLERMPRALSGGQRQRVAMGRAIVREPHAFLLDEPLSNLDAKLRFQMRAEMKGLQKKLGTTMVYVTHDQTEAMTLGDRLVLLRQGKIQQIGTPRELYSAPRNLFVAGFIGSPAMNFLPAEVKDNHLRLPMVQIPLEQLSPGEIKPGHYIAGIRPEHMYCTDDGQRPPHAFQVKVEIIEWLGADAYVHFETDKGDWSSPISPFPDELGRKMTREGGVAMTARLDPSRKITSGESLTLAINQEKIHLFDISSGLRKKNVIKHTGWA